MIIYSNTTPFIALSSIDRLDLLPEIFGKVHVAKAVIDECTEGGRIVVPDLTRLSWIIPVADEIDTRSHVKCAPSIVRNTLPERKLVVQELPSKPSNLLTAYIDKETSNATRAFIETPRLFGERSCK